MLIWLFLAVLIGVGRGAAQEVHLPFGTPGWMLSGSASAVDPGDGPDFLRLRNGSAARVDVPVEDGTFAFDLRMPRARGFVGVRFRLDATGSGEEIYFRPHKANAPDAVQYAPVFNGESYWQVFHGAASTASAAFPGPDEWLHVRLDVSGPIAALYLNGAAEPALVARLARRPSPGFFAVYASFPGAQGEGSPMVDVADFVVTPQTPATTLPAPPDPPDLGAGVVRTWQISKAFRWNGDVPTAPPGDLGGWTPAPVDPSGVLLVGRYRQIMPGGAGWGVGARVIVDASVPGTRRFDLGFSDAATVMVNGEVVYAADQRFSLNFPRRQGLVTPSQASLFIPLHEGRNEIMVIVADSNGGWAVTGRFPDPAGLTLGGSS
jgi:hypothetical protein